MATNWKTLFAWRNAKLGFAGAAFLAAGATACLPLPNSSALADEAEDGWASSTSEPSGFLDAEEIVTYAKHIERELGKRSAYVAIVFRTGRTRDKLPEGIEYTHGAFWVYSNIRTGDGRTIKGYAVHNLYHYPVETTRSYLKQDYPVDFVAPTVVDDVGVIIPSPEMQRRLVKLIGTPDYEGLHNEDYSLISNPHNAMYQNCNEFMLDVLTSAAYQTTDVPQLKANLSAYFEPTALKTNLLERLLAPYTDPRLKTDDHEGSIKTTTYRSIANFMEQYGLAQEVLRIERPTGEE